MFLVHRICFCFSIFFFFFFFGVCICMQLIFTGFFIVCSFVFLFVYLFVLLCFYLFTRSYRRQIILKRSIWLVDWILTAKTTPIHSELCISGNEGVLRTPKKKKKNLSSCGFYLSSEQQNENKRKWKDTQIFGQWERTENLWNTKMAVISIVGSSKRLRNAWKGDWKSYKSKEESRPFWLQHC